MAKEGRPLKFKTPQELQSKIDAYFALCVKLNRPLTITGLALALDTTRETLLEYEGEVEGREKSPEYAYTIKKAKLMCQNFAEEFLYSGKQVAGAIFNLKNNYGWKDSQQVEQTKTFDVTGLEELKDEDLDGLIKGLQNRVGNGTTGEGA